MDREKEAAVLRHALSVNPHTLRRERKLSQEKLEGLTGVSANAIGKIERGITNVQLDTLAALASGLGVSVRQLLDPPADSAAVSHFIETEGKELILSALSSLPTDEQDFLCRLAEEYVRHYHETHPTSVYDPNE